MEKPKLKKVEYLLRFPTALNDRVGILNLLFSQDHFFMISWLQRDESGLVLMYSVHRLSGVAVKKPGGDDMIRAIIQACLGLREPQAWQGMVRSRRQIQCQVRAYFLAHRWSHFTVTSFEWKKARGGGLWSFVFFCFSFFLSFYKDTTSAMKAEPF